MSEELEAMGTAVEGGLIAKALEGESARTGDKEGGECLNCGTV